MATRKELLCAGFIRAHQFHSITMDIVILVNKYLLSDSWCDMHGDGLQIVGEKIKVNNHFQKHINYGFGNKIVHIDPSNATHCNTICSWKLKLQSRHKNVHVCCGIGIIHNKHCQSILSKRFTIFSSNHSDELNAIQTQYKWLIGVQCGTFNQILEYDEYMGFGMSRYRRRWTHNGHIMNVEPLYPTGAMLNGLTSKDCCFMADDIITMSLNLEQLQLGIYINDCTVAKYSKSLKELEKCPYRLCIWLVHHKQSIEII
eukprot:372884_1